MLWVTHSYIYIFFPLPPPVSRSFRVQDTGPREMRVSTVSVEDIKKCRLITAIKTPYNTNGSIDIPAFDRMMEAQIAAGVEGVVVGGTTGKSAVK